MTRAVTAPVSARLMLVARDIKLSHSVFALPFALLATFLAADGWPGTIIFALIVLCMILARTCAMAFNRWADRRVDATNPRTVARAVPSGRVNASFMLMVAIVCAAGFMVTAAGFWLADDNIWPLFLSPFVLLWLCLYSLTKRFTWLCHLFLGSALALSPIAAVVAVEPAYLSQMEPYLLAGMVLCWVAGFDVIYAMQDVRHDRETGLYSMPARLGVERALWISRLLHLAAASLLLALALMSVQLQTMFSAAVMVTIALLVLEHTLIFRDRDRHLNAAFFTINGLISLLLGAAGIWDVLR